LRILRCNSCKDPVEVFELPREFLDPLTYLCGLCLMPPKLEQKQEKPKPVDPQTMEIPF
jgi:hypothetical protein